MQRKTLNWIGCALLALATLAPVASAHNNSGSEGGYTPAGNTPIANGGGMGIGLLSGGSPKVDDLPAAGYVNGGMAATGNAIRLGAENDFVSGRYVSSHQGGPLVVADGTGFNIDVGADVNLLPKGILLPAGGAFCDAEVTFDSNTVPLGLANEAMVDDSGTIGLAANGLWDDGGLDGACHVTTYATGIFDTPGCPAGTAYAEDAVSGSTVLTGAGCDLLTVVTPSGSSTGLVALGLCELNEAILQTDPGAVTTCLETYFGCPGTIDGCSDKIVEDETGCPTVAGLVTCLTTGPFLTCVEGNLNLGVVSCLPPLGGDVIGINHCDYPSSLGTDAETCVIHSINCELNPDVSDGWHDCFYPPETTCGSDSLTDSINYGEGGLVGTGPIGVARVHDSGTEEGSIITLESGAPWPADCGSSNGAAQQYVMDGVHVEFNGAGAGEPLEVSLSLSTAGFVDSSAASLSPTVEPVACYAAGHGDSSNFMVDEMDCQGGFVSSCTQSNAAGVWTVDCNVPAGTPVGACINGIPVEARAFALGTPTGTTTSQVTCGGGGGTPVATAASTGSPAQANQQGQKTTGAYDCIMTFTPPAPGGPSAYVGWAYCRDRTPVVGA